MVGLQIEVNGKPFSAGSLESAIIEAAIGQIKERVAAILTPEEISQIKLNFKAATADKISVGVEGPDELVEKARFAINNPQK